MRSGAGDFPPTHYSGFAALKVVDARRDKLYSNGGERDQYVAFDRVSQAAFEKIQKKRLELVMKAALAFPDIEILIVKIPTQPHEKSHGQLGQLILLRTVAPMNLHLNDFAAMGSSTRTTPSGSFKESDFSWKNANVRVRNDDFPCLVVEAGMSESLGRLRGDASWWMENSAGKANIVLIIWIRKATKTLHIEKYIPGPSQTRTSPRLPRPAYANLAATIVIDCPASPPLVTGAPAIPRFMGSPRIRLCLVFF